MNTDYEICGRMDKEKLKLGDIISATWQIMKKRPEVWALLIVMFFLPSCAAQEFLAWRAATQMDKIDLAAITSITQLENIAAIYQPVVIWALVLSFYTDIAHLVLVQLVYNEFSREERLPYGDLFYRGIRSFFAMAFTRMVILMLLFMVVFTVSALTGVLGIVAVSLLLPLLFVLAYAGLMIQLGYVFASLSGIGGFKLMILGRIKLGEDMMRVLGRYVLLFALAHIPAYILEFAASLLLAKLNNQLLACSLEALLLMILSVCGFFVTIAMTVQLLNIDALQKKDREAEI